MIKFFGFLNTFSDPIRINNMPNIFKIDIDLFRKTNPITEAIKYCQLLLDRQLKFQDRLNKLLTQNNQFLMRKCQLKL